MKLLNCISDSLSKQRLINDNGLISLRPNDWFNSKEGFLFIKILYLGYITHGIYDYITIIKLYHKYGKIGLSIDVETGYNITEYYDSDKRSLNDIGFESLCVRIDEKLNRNNYSF